MTIGKLAPLIREYYPEYYSWNEYPADQCALIGKVKDKWGILGNFAPTPLIVNDVPFVNAEQLFQMMKFTDVETLLSIYNARGLPIKWMAKAGERKGLRREYWGRIIIDCMKFCLQTKYDQSHDFRTVLAETGELYIVEDQTHSKTNHRTGQVRDADTWGVVLRGDRYVGSNLLGRLLMELRSRHKFDYHLPDDTLDFISCLKLKISSQ
ncbi:MAG: NADAR family protein [Prevotella sp.]|nr:NADAR family protein [Prevotella sp.]